MTIKIERKKKDGNSLLIVEGDMTVYDVQTLLDEMTEGFKVHQGLLLDLDGVGECDVTGVQLLCSAVKTGARENKAFSVLKASAPVLKALARAGLEAEQVLNPLNS